MAKLNDFLTWMGHHDNLSMHSIPNDEAHLLYSACTACVSPEKEQLSIQYTNNWMSTFFKVYN